jgi:DNA modification methylase
MNNVLSNSLAVTYVSLDALSPCPNNARVHSKQQVRQIASSIKAFGFLNPILVDDSNVIVAGHGRVAAAKLLGMRDVPTIKLSGLSEAEIRAYILADNKLAERAGWDPAILAIELQHLLTLDSDLDITLTGFEVAEIDVILRDANANSEIDDVVDLAVQGPAITQVGDVWLLGKHRVLCGNSLEQESYKKLMAGRKAKVAFSDPPFNVPIDGHATGNGAVHHRNFAMGCGEMSEAQFIAFLTNSFNLAAKHTTPGSVHFVCIDWRHLPEILAASEHVYDSMLNLCVWIKNNAGLGSFYRSQHELIVVFRNGQARHQNNIQLGRFGRNRTNVWEYPNANTMSRQGEEGNLLSLHPTVKPVAMIADALLDCSTRGDIVLDPFLGSGSTLLAAERTGRICYGLEIDPRYVDVAIRRWQKHTGERAVHAAGLQLFDDSPTDTGCGRG